MTKDFEPEIIRTLANILKEADLSEVEYEGQLQGKNFRIRLAKQQTVQQIPLPTITASIPPSAPTLQQPTVCPPCEDHLVSVKSPIVGTSYLSPQPGAAPFVKVGDVVKKGDTLLIIEAMKVMNAIKAPVTGIIKSIHASDSKPVEFGEILIKMEQQG